MIKRQTAFVVGNEVFATLEQAQKTAIKQLAAEKVGSHSMTVEDWLELIVSNKDRVVDILTTTETSLTAARKINGGKKTRKKPTAVSEPPPPELPGMEPKAA